MTDEKPKQRRKIVQIATTNQNDARRRLWYRDVAVCDDGSVWSLHYGEDKWERLPDIPQD